MNAFLIACVVALFALVPFPVLQTVLAAAASTLFESTPFILAGALLAGVMPRQAAWAAALLGCGCNSRQSARSLPVAAASAVLFGPPVAAARLLAAWCVRTRVEKHVHGSYGGELCGLFPVAIAAAVAMSGLPRVASAHISPAFVIVAAAACGFLAPCGFGTLAVAAAVRPFSQIATAVVLCTGGLLPRPSFFTPVRCATAAHDGAAYACAALACFLVAAHHGAAIVNPRFAPALWACAVLLTCLAWRHRSARASTLRWAPFAMLAAALGPAPAPLYYAGETTLAQAYAGERIEFTGTLARDAAHAALIRYAMTCCRADAQPVRLELDGDLPFLRGQWVRASGVLVRRDTRYVFHVMRATRAPTPSDPYVYR